MKIQTNKQTYKPKRNETKRNTTKQSKTITLIQRRLKEKYLFTTMSGSQLKIKLLFQKFDIRIQETYVINKCSKKLQYIYTPLSLKI